MGENAKIDPIHIEHPVQYLLSEDNLVLVRNHSLHFVKTILGSLQFFCRESENSVQRVELQIEKMVWDHNWKNLVWYPEIYCKNSYKSIFFHQTIVLYCLYSDDIHIIIQILSQFFQVKNQLTIRCQTMYKQGGTPILGVHRVHVQPQ